MGWWAAPPNDACSGSAATPDRGLFSGHHATGLATAFTGPLTAGRQKHEFKSNLNLAPLESVGSPPRRLLVCPSPAAEASRRLWPARSSKPASKAQCLHPCGQIIHPVQPAGTCLSAPPPTASVSRSGIKKRGSHREGLTPIAGQLATSITRHERGTCTGRQWYVHKPQRVAVTMVVPSEADAGRCH